MLTIETKWYRATLTRTDDGTVVMIYTHCLGDNGGMWRLNKRYFFDTLPFHAVCDDVHEIIMSCPAPEIKRVNRLRVPIAAQMAAFNSEQRDV